jgi:hypothetical protein
MDDNNFILIATNNFKIGHTYNLLTKDSSTSLNIFGSLNSNIKSYLHDSRRLYILGHPFYHSTIDNDSFFSQYLNKQHNNAQLSEINGEFLLFEENQKNNLLKIINSKVGTPIFWYL